MGIFREALNKVECCVALANAVVIDAGGTHAIGWLAPRRTQEPAMVLSGILFFSSLLMPAIIVPIRSEACTHHVRF